MKGEDMEKLYWLIQVAQTVEKGWKTKTKKRDVADFLVELTKLVEKTSDTSWIRITTPKGDVLQMQISAVRELIHAGNNLYQLLGYMSRVSKGGDVN